MENRIWTEIRLKYRIWILVNLPASLSKEGIAEQRDWKCREREPAMHQLWFFIPSKSQKRRRRTIEKTHACWRREDNDKEGVIFEYLEYYILINKQCQGHRWPRRWVHFKSQKSLKSRTDQEEEGVRGRRFRKSDVVLVFVFGYRVHGCLLFLCSRRSGLIWIWSALILFGSNLFLWLILFHLVKTRYLPSILCLWTAAHRGILESSLLVQINADAGEQLLTKEEGADFGEATLS